MRLTNEERRLIDLIRIGEQRAGLLLQTWRLRAMGMWLDQREALLDELYRQRRWRRERDEVAA